MCISLVAPGQVLHIHYASESVSLQKRFGKPAVQVDLLLGNDSPSEMKKIVCIVPQCLTLENGSLPITPVFSDATDQLAKELDLDQTGLLTYTVPDPQRPDQDLHYCGTFRPGIKMRLYVRDVLKDTLLYQCGAGAIEMEFETPIAPNEKRWVRLLIYPVTGPRERRTAWQQVLAYLRNRITLTYTVSGPERVPIDLRTRLKTLRSEIFRGTDPDRPRLLSELAGIEKVLLAEALDMRGTSVVLDDWRTRFFAHPMEPFVIGAPEGTVRVVGSQPNPADDDDPDGAYYEWATGPVQMAQLPPNGRRHGDFTLRFTTRYEPRMFQWVPMCTILALILAIWALFA